MVWPYLADLDLIWDIQAVYSDYVYQPTVQRNPPCAGPDRWLYVNVVVKRSQVLAPIFPEPLDGAAAA